MKRKTQGITIIRIITLAVSAFFLAGMLSFLKPCGPKEDGTWMHCHEAGRGLLILAAVLTLLALLRFVLKKGLPRLAPDILSVAVCIAAMLLPGTFVSLCMMPDMRCRAVMQPGALVFSAVLLVLAGLDLAFLLRPSQRDTVKE